MAGRAGKRRFSVFSLAFLDVMSCGFGAVVLIFLIIHHRADDTASVYDRDLLSESRKLDYLIEQEQDTLAELRERLEAARRRIAAASAELIAKAEQRDARRDALAELDERTVAELEDIAALRADVEDRDREVKRLQAEEEAQSGVQVRTIKGEGDRQYLTGLFVGGDNVLIALDASASMLDSTIVQIVRRRNMSPERQREAPKWRRAQRIVEWLAAQVPIASSFQVLLYNTEAWFPLGDGEWRDSTDPDALDTALEALDAVTPAGGTSLENMIDALRAMRPPPDNVFLITDGLPTQGADGTRRRVVTGRQRQRIFNDAVDQLPASVPVNVILLPLEGDLLASASYWVLAARSGGTYMSPSQDWP